MMHSNLVDALTRSALSIVDNADSIVGTERFLNEVTVTIKINSDGSLPNIKVERDFVPDRILTEEGE